MNNSSSEPENLSAPRSPDASATDAPATPPRNQDTPFAAQVTPGLRKVNASATYAEGTKQDDPATREAWKAMLVQNFAGQQDVLEFLDDMGGFKQKQLAKIIKEALPDLKKAARKLQKVDKEPGMTDPLLEYLDAIVSAFPEEIRPMFVDTHATPFESVDKEQHYTKPDITGTRPGVLEDPEDWGWSDAGTVIELKHKAEIFNEDGTINEDCKDSVNALIQVAKSARSLLMASGSCHVYVVTVVGHSARIFRFDRSSFCVTERFDLTQDFKSLPTFLWRLYNPENKNTCTRMFGGDDTISIIAPDDQVKKKMFEAVQRNPGYDHLSFPEATKDSFWVLAVRFVERDGAPREYEIVRCFTFGGILSISDGLFSRATRVHRVVLEEDADKPGPPPIYALKDAWPQQCRRPEVDFYDFIAKHLEQARKNHPDSDPFFDSFAQCHGSVDLFDLRTLSDKQRKQLRHNADIHRSRPGVSNLEDVDKDTLSHLRRHHTRLLLTPVGRPLKDFATTKSLAQAVFNAMNHHRVVFEAGLIHRDVSEGNVLIREVTAPSPEYNGFLLDWDYAEFTKEGAKKFEEWFQDREKVGDVAKRLKDMTGTFPFMAIEMVRHLDEERKKKSVLHSTSPASEKISFAHGAHHDLESFYWLLVWMVTRHTGLIADPLACKKLFDQDGPDMKMAHVLKAPEFEESANPPLFGLLDSFGEAVRLQNPKVQRPPIQPPPSVKPKGAPGFQLVSVKARAPPDPPALLEHLPVLSTVYPYLHSTQWPTNDPAQEYILPSVAAVHNRILKVDTDQRLESLTSGSRSKRKAVTFGEQDEEEPGKKKKKSETGQPEPRVTAGGMTLRPTRSAGSAGGSKGGQRK